MKHLANKSTLITLISLIILSVSPLPIHAQFGSGGAEIDANNATLLAFSLKYIPAELAAEHLDFLLGKAPTRISYDNDRNLLLIFSTTKILTDIETALTGLDVPAKKKPGTPPSEMAKSPKTLQVHTFWLADGFYNQETSEYLPENVIEALQKIGLTNPGIVARSTTSLISKTNQKDSTKHSAFDSSMSVTFNGRVLQFESLGKLYPNRQQIDLQMEIIISSTTDVTKPFGGMKLERHNVCEVTGSLAAPLGHYMVLGTTNYVGQQTLAGQTLGGNAPEKLSQDGTLDTSRFAFVIQVVEAESFAPKE